MWVMMFCGRLSRVMLGASWGEGAVVGGGGAGVVVIVGTVRRAGAMGATGARRPAGAIDGTIGAGPVARRSDGAAIVVLSLLEDDEALPATLRTPVNCYPEKGIGEGDIVG